MKRCWKSAVKLLLCGLVMIGIAATSLIRQGFIGAERTCMEIGSFTSDTGMTEDLSQEERNAYMEAYAEKAERYYAERNPVRTDYIELNQRYLQDFCSRKVEYLVESRVTNCIVIPIGIADGGNRVTVMASWKAQNIWVEQEEDRSYSVVAPVNDCHAKAVMVQEDGCWKLLRYENFVQTENDTSVLKTGYTTFADAMREAEEV